MPALPAGPFAIFATPGAQAVGIWVAALLTLAVLSYLLGDNLLFRVAEYLLVGIAAGYAVAVAWRNVLWPRLLAFWQDPMNLWYYGLFFLLGLMLLARGVRRLSPLGNVPLAILVGTGAGFALGGAFLGTLLPQVRDTIAPVTPQHYGGGLSGWARAIDVILLILGTVAALSFFTYCREASGKGGRLSQGFLQFWGSAGRKVIMVAFGALLAGAAVTFFTLFQSRLFFLIYDWLSLLGIKGP